MIPYSTDLAARSYLVLEHDGAVVRDAPEAGQVAVADDGSFLVIEPWRDNEVSPSGRSAGRAEALELVEPLSGRTILTLDSCGYWFDFMNEVVEPESRCDEPIVFSDIEVSADGSVVAASGGFWHFGAWSAETGELLYQSSRIEAPFSWPHQIGISPDGSRIVFLDLADGGYASTDVRTGESTGPVGSVISANEILVHPDAGVVFVGESSGDVSVIDLNSWQVVSRLSDVGVGSLLDLALSNEGDILAAVGLGGRVLLWEWETASLREDIDVQVPLAHVGYFPNGDLLVVGAYGEIVLIPVSVEELVEIAQNRIARPFTPSECATYEITSCAP